MDLVPLLLLDSVVNSHMFVTRSLSLSLNCRLLLLLKFEFMNRRDLVIFFGLMVIKYGEHLKKNGIINRPGATKPSLTPILQAFYKTGTVWYFTYVDRSTLVQYFDPEGEGLARPVSYDLRNSASL